MAGHSKQSDTEDGKNSRERQEFKEHIRFEKLLCDLSVTFVTLPSCEMNKEIEHGLEPISDTGYRYTNLKYDIASYNRLEEVRGY